MLRIATSVSILLLAGLSGLAQPKNQMDEANQALTRGDYAVATRLLKVLSGEGDHEAQNLLAFLYSRGTGVVPNFQESARLWQLAAEGGLPEAQVSLGEAYAAGRGVPVSSEMAWFWFRKAAAQGSDYAQLQIQRLFQSHTDVGVVGNRVLWADYTSGGYSFTLTNERGDDVRNVVCRVVFYDAGGSPIDTAEMRVEGTIPAGLSRRISGKVDPSVQRLQAEYMDYKGRYLEDPKAKREVRVIRFDVVR